MKVKFRQSGLSLMEMAVVIAVIALLVGLGLPAVRALIKSFETESGAKSVISAALSTARAIAAKEQKYAGIRFQRDQSGSTYLVFVINSPITINTIGAPFNPYPMPNRYLAVRGIKPIKLPNGVGVFGGDLDANGDSFVRNDDFYDPDNMIEREKIKYVTTFIILFSPQGKLVRKDYMALPDEDVSEGTYDPLYAGDVFSGQALPESGLPLGADDYHIGTSRLSTNLLCIYNQQEFESVDPLYRYDRFVGNLQPVYINPYMGTIIE